MVNKRDFHWRSLGGDPRIKAGDTVRLQAHREIVGFGKTWHQNLERHVGTLTKVKANRGDERASEIGYVELELTQPSGNSIWWRTRDVVLQKWEANDGLWVDDISSAAKSAQALREDMWAAMAPALNALNGANFFAVCRHLMPSLSDMVSPRLQSEENTHYGTPLRAVFQQKLREEHMDMRKPSLQPRFEAWISRRLKGRGVGPFDGPAEHKTAPPYNEATAKDLGKAGAVGFTEEQAKQIRQQLDAGSTPAYASADFYATAPTTAALAAVAIGTTSAAALGLNLADEQRQLEKLQHSRSSIQAVLGIDATDWLRKPIQAYEPSKGLDVSWATAGIGIANMRGIKKLRLFGEDLDNESLAATRSRGFPIFDGVPAPTGRLTPKKPYGPEAPTRSWSCLTHSDGNGNRANRAAERAADRKASYVRRTEERIQVLEARIEKERERTMPRKVDPNGLNDWLRKPIGNI